MIYKWQKQLEKKVKGLTKDRTDSHDFSHATRVRDLGLKLADSYPGADKEIIIAGAYLHDIGYLKTDKGYDHCKFGAKISQRILENLGTFPKSKIKSVADIVLHHEDFKFGKKAEVSIETKIVHDADLIDGFGAIGISRFFMFASQNKIPAWRPEYKKTPSIIYNNISIIHNIDGVIKHGLSECNTKLGKKLISHRLKVMKKFIEEFKKEWMSEV